MKENEFDTIIKDVKNDLDAIREIASMKNIGARLGEACREDGNRYKMWFTHENLGKLLGKKTQTVGYLMRGKQGIHANDLAVICRLLGVSADDLLFGTRSKDEGKLELKIKELEKELAQAKKVISVLLEGKD